MAIVNIVDNKDSIEAIVAMVASFVIMEMLLVMAGVRIKHL